MNDEEFRAIDQRLAAMSERVDAVIEKESRGKPMPILDFKPRVNSEKQGARPPVGMSLHPHTGGNRARYVPEPEWDREISDEALRASHLKFDHAMEQAPEGSIDQIFAEFERQFDEMAQAHRYR